MAKLFNRAKMTTATTGSGTVTLGSASNGFQTFAAAGVSNGDVVQYVIEEGANFEIGTGTYSSSGTSLTRSPTESSNSDNAITLAGQATVSITAVADDLNRLQHGGSDKVTVSSTGASVTGNLAVSGTVDGRNVASDGSKLDGIESGATADQTAAQIRAKVDAASDSNVFTDADHSKLNGIEAGAKNDQTITAGSGLSGGGTGDVTLSHSDTSSQASVNGSGRTYVQDITLDTYGHVTGLATATETVVNTDTNTIPNNATITLSAGNALTGGGNFTTDQSANETITFNHSDTSSQSSVNNSSGTVIQDVTLDGYGHVTGLASVNLDGRYYTQTFSDTRFLRGNADDSATGFIDFTTGSRFGAINVGGVNSGGTSYNRTIQPEDNSNLFLNYDGGGAVITNISNSSGYLQDNQSVRAPIFYDSNNTAYYVNPADTGTALNVNGTIAINNGGSSNTHGLKLTGSNSRIWFHGYRTLEGSTDGNNLQVGEGFNYTTILNQTRSPIFYDSDNTGYYANPAATSNIYSLTTASTVVIGGNFTNNAYSSVSSTRLLFGGGNDPNNYFLGTNLENYGGNYTKLDLRWHTGIRMGAQATYGGVRIFDSEDVGTRLFSVGEGDTNVRVTNNIYAKVLYDFDDTAYYVDPATLSRVYRIMAGGTIDSTPNNTQFSNVLGAVTVGGQSGRACYFDGGGVGPSVWWGNGNSPYGAIDADQANGLRLYHNNASGSWSEQLRISDGYAIAMAQMRAPIFYDSDNTAYYVNPNSTSVLNQINVTTLNSTSDIRFKSDLQKIDNAVDKLKTISGYTYMLKDHDDRKAGLIAQEVENVLPEAVKGSEDKKLLDYQATIALLVEAVKEQSEEIATLKSRLTKLEH